MMNEIPDRPARPWDMFNKNIQKVETEIAAKRLEICRACPELIKLTEQCKKCGCFMAAKTKLPHAECPLQKWGKVTVSYTEEM
jgi:hypothetical protein